MITIGAGSVRRAAVIRTILLATLVLWAMPAYAAFVTGIKTVSGSFYPGGSIVYTVVLTNSSISTQSDNAGNEFSDILPANLTLVSAIATSGSAVATVGVNTVSWNGTLLGTDSVTITINATV